MTLNLHHLTGCSPTPPALHLKALGILRIVAEQADSQARGWWQDEHFCLLTTLDRNELETFFLEKYSPTPFLSPWNKGCGFFKTNDPGVVPLNEVHEIKLDVRGFHVEIVPSTVTLHASVDGGNMIAYPMKNKEGSIFAADMPRAEVQAGIAYFFSVNGVDGKEHTTNGFYARVSGLPP